MSIFRPKNLNKRSGSSLGIGGNGGAIGIACTATCTKTTCTNQSTTTCFGAGATCQGPATTCFAKGCCTRYNYYDVYCCYNYCTCTLCCTCNCCTRQFSGKWKLNESYYAKKIDAYSDPSSDTRVITPITGPNQVGCCNFSVSCTILNDFKGYIIHISGNTAYTVSPISANRQGNYWATSDADSCAAAVTGLGGWFNPDIDWLTTYGYYCNAFYTDGYSGDSHWSTNNDGSSAQMHRISSGNPWNNYYPMGDNALARRAYRACNVSDIRLKKDIIFVKKSKSGINIYEWNYLWSSKRYRGVIAQELLSTHPEAVVKIDEKNQFLAVDYSLIDVNMELVC